jgi:hypothetical protein
MMLVVAMPCLLVIAGGGGVEIRRSQFRRSNRSDGNIMYNALFSSTDLKETFRVAETKTVCNSVIVLLYWVLNR